MNERIIPVKEKVSILKRVRRYFLLNLKDNSLLVKRKAVLLLYMNIAVVILVLPVPPLVYVIRGDLLRPLALGLPAFAGCLFSLFVLRRGWYGIAANLTSIAATISVLTGIAFQHKGTPLIGFSSMIHLAPAVIVFSALFCNRVWTSLLSGVYAVATVMLFLYIKAEGVIDPAVSQTGMIDTLLGILLSFVLALLIVKLSRDALDDVKDESEKNRSQYFRIKEILESVNQISTELSRSSYEMSETSKSFSDSTRDQAASSEEITSAMEEVHASMDMQVENVEEQHKNLQVLIERMGLLSDSIQKMQGLIEKTLNLSNDTSEKSLSGEKSLDLLQEAMGGISGKSEQMTGVVDVINDISEQISLLSLNASIEAARAGEAGRGFAVVADEISKLAVQTSDSLREISALIAATRSMVGKGMASVDDTVSVMGGTINNVSAIEKKMKEINDLMEVQFELNSIVNTHSENVRERTSGIKSSTHEQQSAVAEVSKSINVINEATQTIASASIQLLDVSKGVSTMAEKLKEKVTSF